VRLPEKHAVLDGDLAHTGKRLFSVAAGVAGYKLAGYEAMQAHE
jgi:hypothetical protein